MPGNTQLSHRPATPEEVEQDRIKDIENAHVRYEAREIKESARDSLIAKTARYDEISQRRINAETRSNGGQVVAPGTRCLCHEDQHGWRLFGHRDIPLVGEKIPVITWEERQALHAVISAVTDEMPEEHRERVRRIAGTRTGSGRELPPDYAPPVPGFYDDLDEVDREDAEHESPITDFILRSDLEEIMLADGWWEHPKGGLVRPNGSGENAHAKLHYDTDRIRVTNYSSRSDLPQWSAGEKTQLDAMDYYTLTRHEGDVDAARRALYALGYGRIKPAAKLVPAAVAEPVSPGDDHDRQANWADILNDLGFRFDSTAQGVSWWIAPGDHSLLDPSEHLPASVRVTGTNPGEPRELIAVTPVTGLEVGVSYTPTEVVTMLRHEGDAEAAQEALAEGGWGTSADAPRTMHTDVWPDDTAASVFAERHSHRLKFVVDAQQWADWDGTRWVMRTSDHRAWQMGRILGMLEHVSIPDPENPTEEQQATKFNAPEWLRKIHRKQMSSGGQSAVVRLATKRPEFVVESTQFDSVPHELNTPRGIVNLRTGAMRPSDPTSLYARVTRATPNPAAEAPRWQQFLRETFAVMGKTGVDEEATSELIGWMQKLVGYAAVGEVREHLLPFCFGQGGNGKGVMWELLGRIFGSYAVVVPKDLLIESRENVEQHLAAMSGARLVLMSEVEPTDKFNESQAKNISGGDTLQGRWLYGRPFPFTPTFLVVLQGNHQPRVASGGGKAWWRRMRLIPFNNQPEKPDPNLGRYMYDNERDAIMWWVVEGAMRYYQEGLDKLPKAIVDATKHYKEEEDAMGKFFEFAVEETTEPTETLHNHELMKAYLGYVAYTYETATISTRTMARAFRQKYPAAALTQDTDRRGTYWCGVKLTEAARKPFHVFAPPQPPTKQEVKKDA
ncbi:MAG: phage/plasmid primase, P4 family [Propionibacteriaceae bacterium]|nr:phage/plasmid primase, P4 family [Propionibacteriaceae bacterium]